MHIDDVKLFAKSKNELETDSSNKNIQPGYKNGILPGKIPYAHNEKLEETNNGRNRTAESRKNQKAQRKRNFKNLGILEANTIKRVKVNE